MAQTKGIKYMKIELEDVSKVLRDLEVEEPKRVEIIKALETAAEEQKAEAAAEKKPRAKTIHFTVMPDGGESQYLFKCADNFDFTKLNEAFDKVRIAYHNTKKGQKRPARTNTELIQLAKKKLWKEQKLTLVKNEPLVVIKG